MSLLHSNNVVNEFWGTHRVFRGSLAARECTPSTDWYGPVVSAAGPIHSRRLHQHALERAARPGTTQGLQRCATLAGAFADCADTGAFAQPVVELAGRAASLESLRPLTTSTALARCPDATRVSWSDWRVWTARHQRHLAPASGRTSRPLGAAVGVDRRDRLGGRLQWLQKKQTQT